MSGMSQDDRTPEVKLASQIRKFISVKWPNPVPYEEVRNGFKHESEELLRASLQSLESWGWVVREGNAYTPSNMILAFDHHIVQCRNCGSTHAVKHAYHAGFSNLGFLYCNRDTTVLTFSSYDRAYQQLQGAADWKHPWTLAHEGPESDVERIESALISCPCGGSFSFKNPLLCPSCRGVLMGPMSETIYFAIIDRRIDGEEQSVWKENRV